jgi:transcriptional regulator with GAF, ATPase, and Fis domain
MNLESLVSVATLVAQQRSLESVLTAIVTGLAERPDVALARIWLADVGDICARCPMRASCPDQSRCLHLAASAGRSQLAGGAEWTRTDGAFSRIPFGVGKVGHVGGGASILDDVSADSRWVVRPSWARAEGIRSFAGYPLVFRSEVLGVLAVFRRSRIDEDEFRWSHAFADQAAVAIANARAFEEIRRLRDRLEHENRYLREEVRDELAYGEIVGRTPALERVLAQAQMVASTDSSVLILGESGTGKELVARAIHERSLRRDRPMIKVNCASVPRELFESEFFGHVKGSFTGAVKDRPGRFQLADGGTLLLDEIGEIPLELQSKLLRVLEEGAFERVGEDRTRTVDVRVIAATNRDLLGEVKAGRFRDDLYYRLCVFPIELPPLRERSADIPLLAAHFLRELCRRLERPEPLVTEDDAERLRTYAWPGNIRELRNVLERAVILSTGDALRVDLALGAAASSAATRAGPADEAAGAEPLPDAEIRRLERENILKALERAGGRITGRDGAAALLGLKPSTLTSRMKAMGIAHR